MSVRVHTNFSAVKGSCFSPTHALKADLELQEDCHRSPKPLTASQISSPPVEMRAVGKHLDYVPWVGTALEMEAAERTGLSMLQVVHRAQNYDI